MRRLTLAALLLLACQGVGDAPAPVPTFVVEAASTFVRPVKAEGTMEAVEATPVTAPTDSDRPMKVAWIAEDGIRVKAGDVLVRFDDAEAVRQQADSADDVASAQRKINKVKVESLATRHKRNVTADLAQLETEVASEFITDDIEIFTRNEMIESTIDIELAEAKFKHSRNLEGIEHSAASHELQLHRIDENLAEREVKRADEVLERLEIKAPHDGIVVLNRNWRGETTRIGDQLWPGQKIGEIPHVESMQAALFVLEADAGSLAEGLPAELTIQAHPETPYAASVLRVDTLAKPRHPDVPVHYFGVTLALAATDPDSMRVGQRVTAVIRVEKPDAIVVPRQAVFNNDGRSVVYRESGSSFETVAVELGISSAGRVVVTKGLSAGDVVALRDPNTTAEQAWAPQQDESKDTKREPEDKG